MLKHHLCWALLSKEAWSPNVWGVLDSWTASVHWQPWSVWANRAECFSPQISNIKACKHNDWSNATGKALKLTWIGIFFKASKTSFQDLAGANQALVRICSVVGKLHIFSCIVTAFTRGRTAALSSESTSGVKSRYSHSIDQFCEELLLISLIFA